MSDKTEVEHVVKLATRPDIKPLPYPDAVERLLAGIVCGKPAEVVESWQKTRCIGNCFRGRFRLS